MSEQYITIVIYCDAHGQIVDGEVQSWDDENEAYAYLGACKEDDKYFADGAVVEELPCQSCPWHSPFWQCQNEIIPSPWREAARWGGLPGCPYRNGSVLDEIYRRAAERQHGPDGIMTKIKARWAELNQPEEVTA